MSWLKTRERGSVVGMRFVIWCLRTFGLRPARCVTDIVAAYFFITGGRARRASRRYLERIAKTPSGRAALGRDPGLWTSWLHMRTFAQMLLDRACFWCGMTERFEVSFPNRNELLALQASGRGAVLIGAHVGSFDVLRAAATRGGVQVYLLMLQAVAPKINAVLRSIDPELEAHVIHFDPTSIQSLLELQEHVARGHLIALLGDRKEAASLRRIGRAQFLGSSTEFPLGPLLIANLLECPVYTIFGLRTAANRYEVQFELLSEHFAIDRRQRERELQVWLQRYVARLEQCCTRVPLQWFNFYDFWNDERGSEAARLATGVADTTSAFGHSHARQ